MTKSEFLAELRNGLESCPEQEREERITFYDEMISDLMEEGYSEEDAVGKIGNPGEIAANIMEDIPLSVLVKQRIKPGRTLKGWEILLIILGFTDCLLLDGPLFSNVQGIEQMVEHPRSHDCPQVPLVFRFLPHI